MGFLTDSYMFAPCASPESRAKGAKGTFIKRMVDGLRARLLWHIVVAASALALTAEPIRVLNGISGRVLFQPWTTVVIYAPAWKPWRSTIVTNISIDAAGGDAAAATFVDFACTIIRISLMARGIYEIYHVSLLSFSLLRQELKYTGADYGSEIGNRIGPGFGTAVFTVFGAFVGTVLYRETTNAILDSILMPMVLGPNLAKAAAGTSLCMVCYERPVELVFLPCGHAGLCSICYAALPNKSSCHVCRTKVRQCVKIYIL